MKQTITTKLDSSHYGEDADLETFRFGSCGRAAVFAATDLGIDGC